MGPGGAALFNNIGGFQNAAVGTSALASNTTGGNNVATGAGAMFANTSGGQNTAIGQGALGSNSTGSNNIAVGVSAGFNATGSNNVYLANGGVAGEFGAMYLGIPGVQTKTVVAGVRGTTVTGGEMVVVDANGRLGSAPAGGGAATDVICAGCVGVSDVGFSFAGLGANTFTGSQTIDSGSIDLPYLSSATAGNITKGGALFLHTYGAANTFLGWGSGNLTMTGTGQNTVVGDSAFKFNETGWANTVVGAGALARNTTGVFNIAVGRTTLENNTTGTANTGAGTLALRMNTTGSLNTASGHLALFDNVSGDGNTAVGHRTLIFNTTGSGNTAVGNIALENTTGFSNVAIGQHAGQHATTGSNNIYLGAEVLGVAGESNTMYLGGTQTKAFVAGVRGITTVNPDAIPVVVDSAGQLGTISSSRRFKEDINDMGSASQRLLQLRPVTFRYTQTYGNGTKPIQFGLVAEEVAEVFPELAVRNAKGEVETVHYDTLNVLLLNELQQQQRRIDELERKLNALLAATRQR